MRWRLGQKTSYNKVFDWVDWKLSKWESVLSSCEKNEHGFVEREWGEGGGEGQNCNVWICRRKKVHPWSFWIGGCYREAQGGYS